MYEDEPSDKVHDVLAHAIFGDHPLGRPVIGQAEVVSSVPIPDIAAYHDARYTPGRLVVAAAGSIDHDRLVGLTQAALDSSGPNDHGVIELPHDAPTAASPTVGFHRKDTEQYHLCLGRARPFARRRAPLRDAGARHHPRRIHLVAAVPGGAREARPGLRGVLLRQPVRGLGAGRPVRGHPARQRDPGHGGDRHGAAPGGRGGRDEGRARARPGEREGPHHACDGVHVRADEPARQLAPDGRAAAHARRDPREDRRRDDRGRGRAGLEPVRPGRMSAAGVGADESRFRQALAAVDPGLAEAA